MTQYSTKFVYMKTCHNCCDTYWTTSKRTPKGLCKECLIKDGRQTRKPTGYLTNAQVKKHLAKMKRDCRRRLKE